MAKYLNIFQTINFQKTRIQLYGHYPCSSIPRVFFYSLLESFASIVSQSSINGAKPMEKTENSSKCVLNTTLLEGNETVSDTINGFYEKINHKTIVNIEYEDNYDKPVLLKATSGLGKTFQAAIQTHKLAGNKVGWFIVPNHEVAQEVVDYINNPNYGTNAQAIYIQGMEREGMCQRIELVKLLMQRGINIGTNLCQKKLGNKIIRCPFFDTCKFQQQFNKGESTKPRIFIMQRNYLYIKTSKLPEPDFVIIDENFLDVAKHIVFFELGLLWNVDTSEKYHSCIRKLLKALSTFTIGCAANHLKRNSITVRELQFLFDGIDKFIRLKEAEFGLSPEGNDHQMMKQLSSFKLSSYKNARLVLSELIQAYLSNKPLPNKFKHINEKIYYFGLNQLAFDASSNILILDATADLTITERILGREVFLVEIKAPRLANITQVIGAPVSNLTLAGNSKSVQSMKRHLMSITVPTLVVSPKSVLNRLKVENPNLQYISFKSARGSNAYTNIDNVIVIGREQFPHYAVENDARCWCTDDPILIPPHSDKKLLSTIAIRHFSDGTLKPVEVSTYADKRMQITNEQFRNAETLQAIDRTRPVRALYPKSISILNDDILGIPISQEVEWANFKQEASIENLGFDYLIKTYGVIPLSKRLMAQLCAPIWKKTINAGKMYLDRKFPTQADFLKWVVSLSNTYIETDPFTNHEWRVRHIEYHTINQTNNSEAIIIGHTHDETEAALEKMLNAPIEKWSYYFPND